MGNLRLKQQDSTQIRKNNFVLSDVSKGELQKRRVPVYPYLL